MTYVASFLNRYLYTILFVHSIVEQPNIRFFFHFLLLKLVVVSYICFVVLFFFKVPVWWFSILCFPACLLLWEDFSYENTVYELLYWSRLICCQYVSWLKYCTVSLLNCSNFPIGNLFCLFLNFCILTQINLMRRDVRLILFPTTFALQFFHGSKLNASFLAPDSIINFSLW